MTAWAHWMVEAVGALAPTQAALIDVKVQPVWRGAGPGVDPPLGNCACIQPARGAKQGMQALDGGLNRIAGRGSLHKQQ